MASKSRKNRTKFKLTKELVILVCSIVVLIVAAIIINLPTSASLTLKKYNGAIETYNAQNSTQYSYLPTGHVFKDINLNGIEKKKKSNDYTFVFYGSLSNATFLENLSVINTAADDYDVKRVYLWYADYVENATTEFKTTAKYREQVSEYEAIINKNINSLVEGSDGLYLSQNNFELETYPALLVFKSDSLIYNSQTYSKADDSSDYTWNTYITQAFKYAKADEILANN